MNIAGHEVDTIGDKPSPSWEFGKIPRLAHFFWGNRPLPFMRYMTLYSFRKFNPSWEMKLHIPEDCPSSFLKTWDTHEHKFSDGYAVDYFDRVQDLGVEIKMHKESSFLHPSPVYRSDQLRVELLLEEGGAWSDMDIIYIQPMDNIYENKKGAAGGVKAVVMSSHGFIHELDFASGSFHSIGFLLSAPEHRIYSKMKEMISSSKVDETKYQSIGSDLMKLACPDEMIDNDPSVLNLDYKVIYPYSNLGARMLIAPIGKEPLGKLNSRTVGVHWYAGDLSVGEWAQGIGIENYSEDVSVISILMDHVLSQ